ncbi:low-density lipoprotein receptor-related protein 2-like isoform X2 [Acanthaster planci]|uniref:Low-density lipoprotein receptor-related protein 2-like isoform X2 n=1 Tax=Acanthaster planci TaxID=133434 RepID=A0A8B7ZHR5_ACAPL|nr:low-density lipoprotein receptor-related protein 2-like isoform X2 [Acanthaster planci]
MYFIFYSLRSCSRTGFNLCYIPSYTIYTTGVDAHLHASHMGNHQKMVFHSTTGRCSLWATKGDPGFPFMGPAEFTSNNRRKPTLDKLKCMGERALECSRRERSQLKSCDCRLQVVTGAVQIVAHDANSSCARPVNVPGRKNCTRMLRGYSALLAILILAVTGVSQRACPAGHYQCDSGQCISLAWRCNGVFNCDDRSDELGCDYGTCSTTEYQCPSGMCITQSWLCDGIEDCPDREDESNCPQVTCTPDEFRCASGVSCIPSFWLCDYFNDCEDGSDEQGCDFPTCSAEQWTCDSGQCINDNLHCSGQVDCWDRSDEQNCSSARCHPTRTRCGSGECLPGYYRCDHYSDCWDASDEVNCTHDACTRDQFTCNSGQCIQSSYVCDGVMDCSDASDEIHCVGTFSCPPQQWPCPESFRKCIALDKLCDGRQDCPSGEDEQTPCSTNSCGFLSCEYRCHSAPNGGICYCDAGYVVSSNNRSCEDFDECSHWGYCEQGCENVPSSYQCSCAEGYLLEANGHCRSLARDVPYLLVSSGQTITRSNLNGQQATSITTVPQFATPGHLAYHYAQGKIFFSSPNSDKVFSCNFRGGNPSSPQVVVQLVGNSGISELAVDWVSDKLYILENMGNRIEMANLDGSHRTTVIGSSLKSPSGLALDPVNGFMFFGDANLQQDTWHTYYSNYVETQKIERAFMDGSHRFVLTDQKVYTVSGIAVDIPASRIYWVDHTLDCLVTITYDGHKRYTILEGGLVLPNSQMLAIYDRYAFIADHTRDAVLRADRFNWTSDITVSLPGSEEEANGVAVYHSSLQPIAPNPCGTDNGGCQHLCVVTRQSDNQGIGYQCKCDIGYKLNEDSANCTRVTSFLLVHYDRLYRGLPLDSSEDYDCMQPLVTSFPTFFYHSYFDAASGFVFYTAFHTLQRAALDGTDERVIQSPHMNYIGQLSYDWLSKNVYWVDYNRNLIAALKMDDVFETETVIYQSSSVSYFSYINVAPLGGYLFWYEYYGRQLKRSWLDGSHVETLLSSHELNRLYSLTVDHRDSLLFWSSLITDSIWHCDFDGQSRTEVTTHGIPPWTVSVFGSYAFFTYKTKVYRVDKNEGSWPLEMYDFSTVSFQVKVYSEDVQGGENECSRLGLNGGCSHFCFGAPSGQRTCGCPILMKLGSDQQSCEPDPDGLHAWNCTQTEYKCADASCIRQFQECNGHADCPNGEDEQGCVGRCRTDMTCEDDPGICIGWSKRCNNVTDCADGSDEQNCIDHRRDTCSDVSFNCSDGTCILQSWRCDTVEDCPDGSDEVNCEGYTCPTDHFSCSSVMRCIPATEVCDGYNDCGDRSDEANCGAQVNCSSWMFSCHSGNCIPRYWRCDNQFDCADGSDELDCPSGGNVCLLEDSFRCVSSRICIPGRWQCDGIADCDDSSDEPDTCPPVVCTGFQCDTCVPDWWVCDGFSDCRDGSDEVGCPTPTFVCPAEYWLCPDTTQCIAFASVCDLTEDCPHGEDEGPQCNDAFCSENNGGCSHRCLDTPFGVECTCPPGFYLNTTKHCMDIDECAHVGTCSQDCSNGLGTFQCFCTDEYLLEPDGRTCKVTDPSTPYLIVTRRGEVMRFSLLEQRMDVIHNSNYEPITASDFDSVTGNIYFSNSQDDNLLRTDINGSSAEAVYSNGIAYVEAIAVDWVGRNIYWADRVIDVIEVSSLDRDHRAVLISQNISKPRGLCLDPSEGSRYIFWADWGQLPRLERAGLDGQDRTVIVSEDLYWPNGVTLDLPTKKVYFGDGRLDFIDSCNYDGTGRRRVVMRSLGQSRIHSITIFEDYMFWTDKGNNEILAAKKFNGENMTLYYPYVYSLIDLHVYHPAKQPSGPNPCSSNPCSHLCVLSSKESTGYSCLCPVGQTLQADDSCRAADTFLVVVLRRMIQGISLDPTDLSLNSIQTVTSWDAYDVDFDKDNGLLYWSSAVVEGHEEDSAYRSIMRAEFSGVNSSMEFAPTAYLGSPVGIAIDHLSRNIYWTNPDKHTIEVMRLDGDSNYRRNVVENSGGETSVIFDPAAICVDPGNGVMYWAENGGMGLSPAITRANMDGSGMSTIITDNLGHTDFITLDIEQQKLYWTEGINQVIERCNVDGTGRETVVEDVHHGMGITVYGNYLYYADSAYEKIFRVDKETGQNPVVMRSNMRELKALRVVARPGPTSNACTESNGGCQHLCLPTGPNTRACGCAVGFILESDGITCGNLSSFAVVSQLKVTRGFGLEGTDHPEAMVPIGGRSRYTLHVDVHVAEQYIYIADYDPSNRNNGDRNGIRRIKPDGSGFQNIAVDSLGHWGTRGLTVDWIAGNVYWSSAHVEESFVEVSQLDGSLRKVLWKTRDDKPRAMAVNPIKRYLYWADYGQTPKIVRSFLDCTNRTELVTRSILIPRDICVDVQTHDVFWVDSNVEVLEKIDWQGGNRQTIRAELPRPYGLAVFRDSVYWVDRNLEKIFQASKLPNSNKDPVVFRRDLESLRDIAIFDASNQPSVADSSACSVNNGGCEHLCFAMPEGVAVSRICQCSVGYLADNGQDCLNFTSYLVYVVPRGIRSVNFDPRNEAVPSQQIQVDNLRSLVVHDTLQRLYWVKDNHLMYVSIHGGPIVDVKELDIGSSVHIALDWIHNRLYFASYYRNAIYSTDLDGNDLQLVTHVRQPLQLIINPCLRVMYFTSTHSWFLNIVYWSSTGGGPKERLAFIISHSPEVTIDFTDGWLYYTSLFSSVRRIKLDGSVQETVLNNYDSINWILVHGDFLYFTQGSYIKRIEKDTGADLTVISSSRGSHISSLHVYNGELQTCTSTPCNVQNGGCSHGCMGTVDGSVRCTCPDDLIIGNDGRVCVPTNATCSGTTEFTCADGSCIPISWACDLDSDCGDSSDEAPYFCFDHTCESSEFQCNNGRCVPSSYRCDFDNDCRDNSDENDCPFPTCGVDEYTCPNARCIPLSYLCDEYDDCRDGNHTDERNCPEVTCRPGFVSCPNNHICIHPYWRCDGDNDCLDNSDENPLYCQQQDCTENGHRCDSGQCISGLWLCDDDLDCLDGSDEGAYCNSVDFTCAANYFTCDNKNCIHSTWICDSDNDCGDGSDEDERHNCDEHQCSEDFYTCRQNRPNRNRCIPMQWLCDGLSDCEHADDEDNCTRTTCDVDQFACDNGLCIPQSWFCDHDNDCGDQSDEGGHCDYRTCSSSEFTCRNGRCIPASWQCDTDNDCRDYSDEQNCATPPPCQDGYFECLNGNCILDSLVCDKTNDCTDMSDEMHCDINECDNLEANQCEHYCNDTRTGYFCSCQAGYTLEANGKTCRDNNECNEIPGVCSQLCENTRGSYFCKCAEGYDEERDGRTCKHTQGGDASLIFSNRYYIRKLSLDGQQYDLIKDGLFNAIALDYDLKENRLYYLDTGTDKIYRMFFNSTEAEVIVPYALGSGQGLAVDWVGRKLYWLDSARDVLEVSELDGTLRKTLVFQDMVHPRAISVDPRNGSLYWTDWGLRAYIGRMGMDGSNPTRIINEGLVWPNGLTVCYACDKLYWADAHLNYIGFSNMDGSYVHKLPGEELAHPYAVSVFEEYIYWTDWDHGAIFRANKSTGANRTMMREVLHRPFDIHVLHPLRQDQSLVNPCGSNNGGCSHLCLLAPEGGYTCTCPDNFILSTDGQNCLANCSVLEYRCADNSGCIPLSWKCDTEADCPDGSDELPSCPVRHCDLGYFQCDNLQCVAGFQLCNGEDDCGDGSDEPMCDQTHCQAWEFRCSTGNCILHNQVCDQRNNCPDGSDENAEVCQSRTCSPGYFQCDNGYCIPEAWRCDFDNDCGDNSDEPHRECQQVTCPSGWESCRTNYRCIPSWAICNGYDNCRDNSDEENCEERTCDPGQFRCSNHQCIPQRWHCDFELDCDDGSDESADCPFRSCSESEFRCATQQCIPTRWVCDHDDDCGDMSDELACINHQCLEGYVKCTSGHCINENYLCDGDRDCLDYSDEINCPTRLPGGLYCFASEFTCNNTLCIRTDWVCDGDNDCGDGSDELLSICATRECDTSTRYRCYNGRCIPQWKTCDEVDDCGDASDENNHDLCQAPVECLPGQYKCPSGACIPGNYICDAYNDCGDSADERGCNDGPCAESTCEGNCTDTDWGHICACFEGLELGPDHLTCVDINECQSNPCPQLCNNIKGSYQCQCAPGYFDKGTRGMDCKADGDQPTFVFGDGSDIRRYNNNTKKYTAVAYEQGLIQDIDYNVGQDALYWVDIAHSAIKRARFPANEDQLAVVQKTISNLNRPQGISVDWIAGNVYWTDLGIKTVPTGRRRRQASSSTSPRVAVAKLDGRYSKDLITTAINKPTAIAVNPVRGVLYWTDTGTEPKIEIAWMNGGSRSVLVSDGVSNPTGLTIDFANYGTVYFCDNKENRIESMNWNGEQRKLLKRGDYLEHPFQLEVFSSFLHITTEPIDFSGKILTLDKLGRGIPTTLIRDINLPSGLVVRQEQRYPNHYVNRCDKNPCSHLCLLTPQIAGNRVTDGYVCDCPNGDVFKSGSTSTCSGAKEEPTPLPRLPNCQCKNGGSCISPGKCECPSGFEGDTCEKRTPLKHGGPSGGATAAIVVVVLIIVVVGAVFGFFLIRRYRNRTSKSGADGAVSYRGGANIEMPAHPPTTDGTGVVEKREDGNFENPVYNMQSPELQAVGNYDNVTPTAQAEALPTKVDLGADLTQAGPLPEKTGLPTPAYSPTEAEGDTNVLVTKDKM